MSSAEPVGTTGRVNDSAPRLEFHEVRKSFFGVEVLKGISFSAREGAVVGLIGENGAGKSTLMNILGGVLQPDSGTMRVDGEVFSPAMPSDSDVSGIVFVHQELNIFDNLSIVDNIFLTNYPKSRVPVFLNSRRAVEQARTMLQRVGLDRDPRTTVDLLSPGERQQVEIAKALRKDPRILILDEPTTSLTARETEKLFEVIAQLKGEGVTVLYISHILEDIKELADQLVVLRDGELVTAGPIADHSVDSMVQNMVGRQLGALFPDRSAVIGSREVVLEATGITEPGIVHDVDIRIRKGEVIGLFGLMGAGRTELARIIFGLDSYAAGEVVVGGARLQKNAPTRAIAAGLAFVTEDRRQEGLFMESSVADNIAIAALRRFSFGPGIVRERKMVEAAGRYAKEVGLKASRPTVQPVKSLSGGNQQKAVISKWMLTDPKALILDEPTRGIDVGAKAEIYRLIDGLAASGAGILMISSELDELIGTCDRVLVMRKGEVVREFLREDYDQSSILAAAFGQETMAPKVVLESESFTAGHLRAGER